MEHVGKILISKWYSYMGLNVVHCNRSVGLWKYKHENIRYNDRCHRCCYTHCCCGISSNQSYSRNWPVKVLSHLVPMENALWIHLIRYPGSSKIATCQWVKVTVSYQQGMF